MYEYQTKNKPLFFSQRRKAFAPLSLLSPTFCVKKSLQQNNKKWFLFLFLFSFHPQGWYCAVLTCNLYCTVHVPYFPENYFGLNNEIIAKNKTPHFFFLCIKLNPNKVLEPSSSPKQFIFCTLKILLRRKIIPLYFHLTLSHKTLQFASFLWIRSATTHLLEQVAFLWRDDDYCCNLHFSLFCFGREQVLERTQNCLSHSILLWTIFKLTFYALTITFQKPDFRVEDYPYVPNRSASHEKIKGPPSWGTKRISYKKSPKQREKTLFRICHKAFEKMFFNLSFTKNGVVFSSDKRPSVL